MDLKCLFLTVLAVLRRDGVQEGAEKKVNDTPLVSVIMATYRRERELSCALESLARQTWKNQEIILVDDNADSEWNARVKKIVEGFQRRYQISLKYVVNETNKGSASSRNRGIEKASGMYITFLDDDDKYRKEKIEQQVRHMQCVKSNVSITDLALYREDGRLEEVRKRNYLNPGVIQEAFAGKTLSVSYDRNGYTDVRKGVFAEVRRISTD